MIKEVPWSEEIEKAPYIFKRDFTLQEHNYFCGVCKQYSAVADCYTGILQPCWDCQGKGYVVVKINFLVKLFDKLGLLK